MGHVSDGDLRRWLDEPTGISAEAARHAATCGLCRGRSLVISGDATAADGMLRVSEPSVQPAVALRRVRQRIAASSVQDDRRWHHGRGALSSLGLGRFGKVAAGLAAAAAIVVSLAVTPAGSWAQGLLTIFEPKQVAAVPINLSDLHTLPHLDEYGTISQVVQTPISHADSAVEASAASGLAVLTPVVLPPNVRSAARYAVLHDSTASFTFRAAMARDAAARKGAAVPPMPSNIDGSMLTVHAGPGVVAYYGNAEISGSEPTSPLTSLVKPQVDRARGVKEPGPGPNLAGDVPSLVIAQVKVPVVTSTGATAAQLEQYLLAQPGVAPGLAAAIKSIGDPAATLPIPIPVDRAMSHPVSVQGVGGLALSDATGIGTVVWQKNGVIYAVAGTHVEQQLLAVANSLH